MDQLDIKDILNIFVRTIVLTAIFAPLLIGIFYLVHINVNFAYYISDSLNIPRDLSLTLMSAGFANNIIILSSVFEFGIIAFIINKLTKTQFYENSKNFVMNL